MVDLHLSDREDSDGVHAANGSLEQLHRLAHRDSRQFSVLADALCEVARFRSRRGAPPATSEELYDEAIASRNASPESVGPELMFRIQSLLAYDFDREGRHYDAIRHYEESLKLAENCELLHPLLITVVHNNLGMLHSRLDNFSEAERHYLQAIENLPGKSDENDPRAAAVHNNLGVLYFKKKYFERARAEHNLALRIRRRIHDGDRLHPDLGQTYENLALLHETMGDTKTARVYRDRVREIRKAVIPLSISRRTRSARLDPASVNQAG